MFYEGIDIYGQEWKPGDKARFMSKVYSHLDDYLHWDAGITWYPFTDPIDGMVYGIVAYPDYNDAIYVGQKLGKAILDFECDYSYTMRDMFFDAEEYIFGPHIWDGTGCYAHGWYEDVKAACIDTIMDYYNNLYKSSLDSDDPETVESARFDLYNIRRSLEG